MKKQTEPPYSADGAKDTPFRALCAEHTLLQAWAMVKAKNSSGGVDGETVASFDQNLREHLAQIRSELLDHTWKPQPYLIFEIPKKNKAEKRRLGLLSIKDKVIQRAIAIVTEPTLDKLFLSNSYAYRPQKGHYKAVMRTKSECANPAYSWVLRIDIDDFFDTIPHDRLFNFLAAAVKDVELQRLIELCVQMGSVRKGTKWQDSKRGVPQGAILSPMLANLYLHSLDLFISMRDLPYVRYADDLVVLTHSKEEAEQLLADIRTYLRDLLSLNINPPLIAELTQVFEFLGIYFTSRGISLSEAKMAELKRHISEMKISGGFLNARSRNTWKGIQMYYAAVLPQDVLYTLDKFTAQHFISLVRELSPDIIPGKKELSECFRDFEFLSQEMRERRNVFLIVLYNEMRESRKSREPEVVDKSVNRKLIEERKREYRKRENEESELLVASTGAYIGCHNSGVVVRQHGKALLKNSNPYLKHITIIGGGVTISTNAIALCMSKGIAIDIFSGMGKHEACITSPSMLEASLWRTQSQMTDAQRLELARRLIVGKLKNQRNLIKYFCKYHKSKGGDIERKYEATMEAFDTELARLDTKEKALRMESVSAIMGAESQAAVAYWDMVRDMVADCGVSFERRDRKGATDLFNCMLNYGYAILYSRIWQALLAAKLNPYDSVMHVRQHGKPTMAFDMVELFRSQAVDRVVITLVQKRRKLQTENGILDEATKKELALAVLERMNRYENYRGTDMTLLSIFRRQAGEMADYIAQGKTFKPYIAKW